MWVFCEVFDGVSGFKKYLRKVLVLQRNFWILVKWDFTIIPYAIFSDFSPQPKNHWYVVLSLMIANFGVKYTSWTRFWGQFTLCKYYLDPTRIFFTTVLLKNVQKLKWKFLLWTPMWYPQKSAKWHNYFQLLHRITLKLRRFSMSHTRLGVSYIRWTRFRCLTVFFKGSTAAMTTP